MRCTAAVPTVGNVVALDDVLDGYDALFQVAVREALMAEGFEFSSELPNLQLAREIREAVGGLLEAMALDPEWESLHQFLEWAEHQGVLVDLSPAPDHWPATA